MVDKPQQLAVVIEVGSAEPFHYKLSMDGSSGCGVETVKKRLMRHAAVEPAAVAVDGRSILHVIMVCGLIRLMLPTRSVYADRLDQASRLATVEGSRGGYVVPERQ